MKSTTANGIAIFNPLDYNIHGHPLMVPAHEYNKALGVLIEARAYIAKHTTPTVTEASHGSIVERLDAIIRPVAPVDGDTTIDLFWQLLRAFEEAVGSKAGPLDSELLRAGYNHFSKLTGKNLQPSYVKGDM